MTDFNELIPEMSDWNNGNGIDVDDWISCMGNYQLAIGYSRVFWPTFVEYDEMVLREGAFSAETVSGFMAQCKGDKSAVEGVINHFHLESLHMSNDSDATRERIAYLGNVLKDIYQVKLRGQFPARNFEVVFDDSFKDVLMDYQLTFFQVR